MPTSWTASNPIWQRLSGPERAAAMALLEPNAAGNPNYLSDARNVLGSIINRAELTGQPLAEHVSGRIYQPTIMPAQEARLERIVRTPEFAELTALAGRRLRGEEPDWVGGAVQFLAPEATMRSLTAKNPQLYRSWPSWTGYGADPSRPGEYDPRLVKARDSSHVFFGPETLGPKYASAGAAPRQVPARSPNAATLAQAQPRKDDTMGALLPFLMQMFTNPGTAATATNAAPAAAGATPTAGGGLLANLFGGQQGSGQSQQDQSLALAQNAAKLSLGGVAAGGQRPQVDLSGLQAIMAARPRLGV